MRKLINGKIYDTSTATAIAEKDHYNNGNYSGTTTLYITPRGNKFLATAANGQDYYLRSTIHDPEQTDWDCVGRMDLLTDDSEILGKAGITLA